MIEEFEEWEEWFNYLKDPDGTINLDKHPEFLEWLENWHVIKTQKFDLNFKNIPGLGKLCNFELPKKFNTEK